VKVKSLEYSNKDYAEYEKVARSFRNNQMGVDFNFESSKV